MKRFPAVKLFIRDVIHGKMKEESSTVLTTLTGEEVRRIRIIGVVVSTYESKKTKRFKSLTIDDFTGQIRVKAWGKECEKLDPFLEGDLVDVIGRPRFFNNELFCQIEEAKHVDINFEMYRRLELVKKYFDKGMIHDPEYARDVSITDPHENIKRIIEYIKNNDDSQGVPYDDLVNNLGLSRETVDELLLTLINDGLIYEEGARFKYVG